MKTRLIVCMVVALAMIGLYSYQRHPRSMAKAAWVDPTAVDGAICYMTAEDPRHLPWCSMATVQNWVSCEKPDGDTWPNWQAPKPKAFCTFTTYPCEVYVNGAQAIMQPGQSVQMGIYNGTLKKCQIVGPQGPVN